MRSNTKRTAAAVAAEIVPESYFAPLDPIRLFHRPGALEVDLGCGDGSFLAALAERNADRNFLGVERLPGRVRSACRQIAQRQLTNARVLRLEAAYAARYLLPPESIAVFHLMFPDPWPKRRHQRRRMVTEGLLQAIHRALVPKGILRICTDDRDYMEAMRTTTADGRFFKACEEEAAPLPKSTFEERFHQSASEIYRVVLRKVSVPR